MLKSVFFVLCAVVVVEAAGSNKTENAETEKLRTRSDKSCEKADIVFVLDSSGSIGDKQWEKVLGFTKKMVAGFTVGQNNVRFGLNTFGKKATPAFHLNAYNTADQYGRAIGYCKQRNDTLATNTGDGIKLMYNDMFTEKNGDRPNVQNIGIVITDGESNNKTLTLQNAEKAREKGVLMIAVGIGGGNDKDELVGIAETEEFVFEVDSFKDLKGFKTKLIDAACEAVEEGCLKSQSEGLTWNFTPIGQTVFSGGPCVRDGQLLQIYTRECIANYTGIYWENVKKTENCTQLKSSSAVTDDLTKMLGQSITDEKETASKLEGFTNKPKTLTYTDIALSAQILEKLTAVDGSSREVGESIIQTVDNLLNADATGIAIAERSNGSSKRIIRSLEHYSLTADLGDDKVVMIESDNIVVEMWDMDDLKKPITGFGREKEGVVNFDNSKKVDFTKTETAIIMSEEVEDQVQDFYASSSDKRMAFTLYRHPKLFLSPEQLEFPEQSPVNSEVIGLRLPFNESIKLEGEVEVIFRPKQDPRGTTTCVFWDFSAGDGHGDWSSEGCSLNSTTDGRIVCHCDHLTSFAILMDISNATIPEEHMIALSVITYSGLGLSTLGLTLTILTFLIFRKKMRFGHGQKVLVNLAAVLLFVNIIFLAGIEQTQNEALCTIVAAGLHYFLLVAFAWMLVEAVFHYLQFVKVLGVYVEKFMWKAAIPSWAIPAFLVVPTLIKDPELYRGHKEYCWVDKNLQFYAFMMPVAFVITVNTALYVLIVKGLTCGRPGDLRSTQSKSDLTKSQVLGSVCVFVLLGLTWVFGFMTIGEARLFFHYVFCILNSFQGFFIFLFHTLRNQRARDSWYKMLCSSRHARACARNKAEHKKYPSSSAVIPSMSTQETSTTMPRNRPT